MTNAWGTGSRLGAVASMLLLGCSSLPTSTVDTVQLVVRGVVTAGGDPVPNADVTLRVTQTLQNGNRILVAITRRTEPDGTFAGQLQTGGPPFEATMTVELTPPPGSSLEPKTIQGGVVSLTSAIPPDTTTINPTFE